MQLFHPLLPLHRTHPEADGLIVLVEVVEEAVLELMSAVDPDVPILGLSPSCWTTNAGGCELGQQLIRVGKKVLRLKTSCQYPYMRFRPN